MSKAFTKETDNTDSAGDDEINESPDLRVPSGSKNYMTPQGAARLQEELRQLLHGERPKLVNVIAWAAGNGDRSENADYIYGKRRLREIDRRIRFLTRRLEMAEVIDPASQKSEQVLFGATVTVKTEEDTLKKFRIVGVDEIDAGQGQVSWLSPIAKALLHAKAGDIVTLRSPRGEEDLEVILIEYK